jgi:hypothetical protein
LLLRSGSGEEWPGFSRPHHSRSPRTVSLTS